MSKAQPGSGYGFISSGYGFSLNTEQPFPDPSETVIKYLHPLLVASDKVGVTPGTVNRYIPTMGGVYLDADTRPTITIEGPGYVCVKATYEANKYFPRTATIIYHSGSTTPVDTNTEGYYPLARVNEVSGVRSMVVLSSGNRVVNRLKAGANMATWWWG